VARADFLPSLSLSFNTGYQAFPPPGFGVPDRMGRAASDFCADPTKGGACQNGGWFADRSIGATLSFPIFDGYRARSNLVVAQALGRPFPLPPAGVAAPVRRSDER